MKESLYKIAYNKMEEVSQGSIKASSLNPSINILESGLDSLGYAQVMLALEDFSKKSIINLDVNWSEIRTIEELVNLFL